MHCTILPRIGMHRRKAAEEKRLPSSALDPGGGGVVGGKNFDKPEFSKYKRI